MRTPMKTWARPAPVLRKPPRSCSTQRLRATAPAGSEISTRAGSGGGGAAEVHGAAHRRDTEGSSAGAAGTGSGGGESAGRLAGAGTGWAAGMPRIRSSQLRSIGGVGPPGGIASIRLSCSLSLSRSATGGGATPSSPAGFFLKKLNMDDEDDGSGRDRADTAATCALAESREAARRYNRRLGALAQSVRATES